MAKIAFNVNRKSGVNFIHSTLVPANRSEEPKFGSLDSTIIVIILLCFVLCVGGLIYPLTH